MTRFVLNPHKGGGLAPSVEIEPGGVCTDDANARSLIALCPKGAPTPLISKPELADALGVGAITIKDERQRMGIGSFKALGASFAIAKIAAALQGDRLKDDFASALTGITFVCASAGNHGLSMAAGAALFGADAVVYLSDTVPDAFADRLRAKGAQVRREGAVYEDSMEAAKAAAEDNGWRLLSDSSWIGYSEPARDVMEGYLIMGAEVADEIGAPPTHIFLQAGVGGLAAACAASARKYWSNDSKICVVEPDAAPALIASIAAGKPVFADGPASNMGRLDCKEPSHLALSYLAKEADAFATVTDEEADETVALLKVHGLAASPSAAAGLAGLHHVNEARVALGLHETSRILIYLSEMPPDA